MKNLIKLTVLILIVVLSACGGEETGQRQADVDQKGIHEILDLHSEAEMFTFEEPAHFLLVSSTGEIVHYALITELHPTILVAEGENYSFSEDTSLSLFWEDVDGKCYTAAPGAKNYLLFTEEAPSAELTNTPVPDTEETYFFQIRDEGCSEPFPTYIVFS